MWPGPWPFTYSSLGTSVASPLLHCVPRPLRTLWRRYFSFGREELNRRKIRWFGNKGQSFKYMRVYLHSRWVYSLLTPKVRRWTRMIGGLLGGDFWVQNLIAGGSPLGHNVSWSPEQLFPAHPTTPWDHEFNLGSAAGPWVGSVASPRMWESQNRNQRARPTEHLPWSQSPEEFGFQSLPTTAGTIPCPAQGESGRGRGEGAVVSFSLVCAFSASPQCCRND